MNPQLQAVLDSVRPALNSAPLTEKERALFLYDLVGQVYEHVKYDVCGPDVDAPEREHIGSVRAAALQGLWIKR